MYWNVVKRTLDGKFVKVVKTIPCHGRNYWQIWALAKRCAWIRNALRVFNKKYYYVVEFDFE